MQFKSEVITSGSGSIGGACYQQGRAGLIRFAKPRNTDKASNAQQAVRNRFSSSAIAWRQDLSQSQRDAWSSYASLTPITGKLGDTLSLSGSQMFRRCNTTRDQAGLPIISDGPTTPGLVNLTPPVVISDVGFGAWGITWTFLDAWNTEFGGAIIIQTSRFLPIGRKSPTTPLRLKFSSLGTDPPSTVMRQASDNAFDQQINTATDQQLFIVRCVAVRADGRISSPVTILHRIGDN